MSLPPPPDVAGASLDGLAPFVISAAANRTVCETTGTVPDPDGVAHPIFSFIATQAGMGQSVAGLCALCQFDVAQGPLLGGTRVEFARALLVGQPYHVRGEIVGLTRKQSRKLGLMDVLEYRLRLVLPEGEPVLVVTNTWMLPRSGPA
jgi:acyl dehydratase